MPSRLLDTIFNMAGFAMGKIKRILCSVWLFERARFFYLTVTCSEITAFGFARKTALALAIRESLFRRSFLKEDGCWPRSFWRFLCGLKFVFVHRNVESKKGK